MFIIVSKYEPVRHFQVLLGPCQGSEDLRVQRSEQHRQQFYHELCTFFACLIRCRPADGMTGQHWIRSWKYLMRRQQKQHSTMDT